MIGRLLTTVAIAEMLLTSAMLSGQTASLAAKGIPPAKASAKTWTPPRTPDGQPDLQGTWTSATITPFERPKEFEGKPILTEEESAELESRAAQNRVDRPPREGDVGDYNRL